ncbi:MAG: sodium/glutamate symporter [Aerococcus sp.]|nr:sodium/glutamate symporter [Aerococcus sp.]
MTISMNMIQTTGFAVIMSAIGYWIQRHVSVLKRLSIPGPVIGGVLFAIIHTILRLSGILQFDFDHTLQEFFQTLFFTTVGFTASVKMLRESGIQASKMILLTFVMIVIQNLVGAGMAHVVGINPLLGLLMGSSALVGGPGTTGAVAPSIADLGFSSALTVGFAAATFGIAAGSILGGPTATWIINHFHIKTGNDNLENGQGDDYDGGEEYNDASEVADTIDPSNKNDLISGNTIVKSFLLLLAVAFVGTYFTQFLNWALEHLVSGVTLPSYIGASLLAFIMRNIVDNHDSWEMPMDEINVLSDLVLEVFLSLALLNLQLWELSNVGFGMLVILFVQLVVMIGFSCFITFPFLGKSYNSVMMTTGFIGYGLGSSYNAVASMSEVTRQHGRSSRSAIIVPLVCSIFGDFINVMIIYTFIGWLSK